VAPGQALRSPTMIFRYGCGVRTKRGDGGIAEPVESAPAATWENGFLLSVLLISAYFPPDGEVGGRRIAKLAEYFPDLGIAPIVLTMPVPPGALDPNPELRQQTRIYRVAAWPDPLFLLSRLKSRFSRDSVPSPPSRADGAGAATFTWRSQLRAALHLPDRFIGWYWPASRRGKEICRRHAVRALFSSGPPWTCHLVARNLKRMLGLPWVADYRDPWTSSALRYRATPPWKRRKEESLEAKCMAEADAVICNTDRLRQALIEGHPQESPDKFITIPNGFEPRSGNGVLPAGNPKLILHTGTVYGSRRIDTFCQALQRLLDKGAIGRDEVRVVFLGEIEPELQSAAQQAAPQLFRDGIVSFQPRLPWDEAQKRLWSADVHLIVQGQYRMQVPAKFFECLPTGKPVLAIGGEGALSDVVNETGAGGYADSENVPEIAAALLRVLSRPALAPDEIQRKSKRYHWSSIAAGCAEVLRNVAGD